MPSTRRLWPLQLPGRLLPVLPVPEAGQPRNVPCLCTSPACPPPELALLRQDSKPSHTLFLPSLDPAPSALQGPRGLTWLASESATLLVAQCDKVGTANPHSTVNMIAQNPPLQPSSLRRLRVIQETHSMMQLLLLGAHHPRGNPVPPELPCSIIPPPQPLTITCLFCVSVGSPVLDNA